MIGRGQVFVRAKDPNGKWHSCDALDLTDESFRMFVLSVLRDRMTVMLSDDPPPELKSRTPRKEE